MQSPVVSTPKGSVRGSILSSFNGKPFAAFRGIPYALSPTGHRRFARPEPYPDFEGVYDATEEGPIFIQPKGINYKWQSKEDSLCLNVFVPSPSGILVINEGQRKKVCVFIHGGGFFMDCANCYVPGDLVAEGDIIVVTINYRLSWLGFLKAKSDQVKGNMGMWDQLLALQWVKNNIAAFGGDEDDIAIGGESIGGESVSALSLMPQAKGLFTKGIVMSGAMYSCPSTSGSSDILLEMLAERLGLSPSEDEDSLINQMKELPASAFELPVENQYTNKFTSIDGEMFPTSFPEMIKDEEYLKSVGFYDRDYLVSLTNNEGAVYYTGAFAISPDVKSMAERSQIPLEVFQKILDWYKEDGHHSIRPENDIMSDRSLSLPTFKFLEASAPKSSESHGERGKTYFLWFDHSPDYIPSPLSGTPHGIDLVYLFDLEPNQFLKSYYDMHTDTPFSEEEKKLKSRFIKLIVDFITNGDPNSVVFSQLGQKWPAYDLTNEFYLRFKSELQVDQHPIKSRIQMREETIPRWLKEFEEGKLC